VTSGEVVAGLQGRVVVMATGVAVHAGGWVWAEAAGWAGGGGRAGELHGRAVEGGGVSGRA
jgi:hypothetical protein